MTFAASHCPIFGRCAVISVETEHKHAATYCVRSYREIDEIDVSRSARGAADKWTVSAGKPNVTSSNRTCTRLSYKCRRRAKRAVRPGSDDNIIRLNGLDNRIENNSSSFNTFSRRIYTNPFLVSAYTHRDGGWMGLKSLTISGKRQIFI